MVVFAVTPDESVFGVAESPDLINWKPQEYYPKEKIQEITRNYEKVFDETIVKIGDNELKGGEISVDQSVINSLMANVAKKEELKKLYSERATDDSLRFKNIAPLKASLKITGENKEISPLLLGIFFEDINYAADGGLYGELIQNRDFEYNPSESRTEGWGPLYCWEIKDNRLKGEILTDNPIHANNPHYLRLTSNISSENSLSGGLINRGYDGIPIKEGENYKFQLKHRNNLKTTVEIRLVSESGKILSADTIFLNSSPSWNSSEITLSPTGSSNYASLEIIPGNNVLLDIDMISLFPEDTFRGRENGLRNDLASTLEALKPKFVRFPGGCVAHGNGIDNIYDWKGSVGKLEERKPLSNIWGYHQSRGLGYFEYFQFCEDIGAEPLPVVAAGVPCQNSSHPSRFTHDDITRFGQQGGIPMDSMDSYIRDILDLIEYANGPVSSPWGSKRAEAGHPQPFNLKYIGIGNEDLISETFKERFAKINEAISAVHPEITVIGTAGPFYEGADYDEGWRFAKQQNLALVDEHYYVEPGWLIYNQDFYDDYDRSGPKVYLGEWAAHLPDRSSTIETALAEALYITSLERNGDIVYMSSYAPLLAKTGHTQWRPDLIYFSNDSIMLTPDYHVMRLAGENSGTRYYSSDLKLNSEDKKIKNRIGASVVKDEDSGDYIFKFVNLLPEEINMTLDLSSLPSLPNTGKRTVLKGKPTDTEPSIEIDDITLTSDLPLSLSPYSLTVIRTSEIVGKASEP